MDEAREENGDSGGQTNDRGAMVKFHDLILRNWIVITVGPNTKKVHVTIHAGHAADMEEEKIWQKKMKML